MTRVGGPFGDTSWRDLLLGPKERIDDPVAMVASYRGPGRERLLQELEDAGKLPRGTTAAAKAGADPIELAHAVQAARDAGTAAGGGAGARTLAKSGAAPEARQGASTLAEMIYREHGMMGLALMQDMGMVNPGAELARGGPVPTAARPPSPTAAAAPGADESASVIDDMQRFVNGAFEDLAHADPAQQRSILIDTIERRAQAGLGENTAQVLARTLLDSPVESVAPSLRDALLNASSGASGHAAPAAAATAATRGGAGAGAVSAAAPAAGGRVAEALHGIGDDGLKAARAAAVVLHAAQGGPDAGRVAQLLSEPIGTVSAKAMARVLRMAPRI